MGEPMNRPKHAKKRTAKKPASRRPVPAPRAVERCPHCEEPRSDEELSLQDKYGPLICPRCEREGCYQCMPAGRGCMCPECEQGEE